MNKKEFNKEIVTNLMNEAIELNKKLARYRDLNCTQKYHDIVLSLDKILDIISNFKNEPMG